MKDINYKEVKKDIEKRMINFDSKRIVKKNITYNNLEENYSFDIENEKSEVVNNEIIEPNFKLTIDNQEDKTLKIVRNEDVIAQNTTETIKASFVMPDEYFQDIEFKENPAINPKVINEAVKPVKKETKGLFKSISDFFADDPKTVEAAKRRAEAKKIADAKKLEEKKLAEEKKKNAKK